MKKFFQPFVVLAFALAVLSCSDNGTPFAIVRYNAYAVQLDDAEFKPVVFFLCGYGDGALSSTKSKLYKGSSAISGASYDRNCYEATVTYPTLAEVMGQYTFEAVSDQGEKDNLAVSLTLDNKPLGGMEIGNFSYYSNAVSMTVLEPVENATHYGIYIRPVVDGQPFPAWAANGWNFVQVTAESGPQNVTVNYDFTGMFSQTGYESVMVYSAAFRVTGTESSMLVRPGAWRLLKNGATSFD
ncbi:MAG: hypothetical protein LUE10_02150 [Alistipes sp.]|nr:hypothetical protein [Alistipes sp.]